MSNALSQALSGLIANLHGLVLLPGILVSLSFALGFISARFRWPGWRTFGGLTWLAAAIVAEYLIVRAIFISPDYGLLGLFLFSGLALIVVSLLLMLIERAIMHRRANSTQVKTPSQTPVAGLGIVVGLLVAVTSLLLPAVTQPLPTSSALSVPTASPTPTAIPTLTPLMPPTNTPHPTIPPTATPLPTLTVTPVATDIPTLIMPPTLTLTPSITLTPSRTPRATVRPTAVRKATTD